MSNKHNLEYDGIKKMLNTMRNLTESTSKRNIIKEDEYAAQDVDATQDQKTDYIVVNDVEVKLHSSDQADLEISEEEKSGLSQLIDNFRDQVTEIADFEEGFNVYPQSIRLDGTISDLDLSFVFIAGDERGVYVNANMLELNQESVEMINKLNKFQHTYEDVVNQMIVTRKTN
jgi:hypothetical protein